MNEFIKSIFTTPVNLWTLPQTLFVAGIIFIIAMFGIFVWWFVDFLKERIMMKIKSPKFQVGDLVTAKGIKNSVYKITEIITYYKLNHKIAFYRYKAENEFAEYKVIEYPEKYLKKYRCDNERN